MCRCIEEVPKQIFAHFAGEYKGSKIISIEISHIVNPIRAGVLQPPRAAIALKINRSGRSRPAQDIVPAAFCPFCGQKY